MRVVIVVPWRSAPDREVVWSRLRPWWEEFGWPIVECDSGDEPFNRGRSQNQGAASLPWDVMLVLDADVVVPRDNVYTAVQKAHSTGGIVLPHTIYAPLDEGQTAQWLAQDDLAVVPEDARLHNGGAIGGLHVIARDAWDIVKYDGETRHRGQDRRLVNEAASKRIPIRRLGGILIHGYHERPDSTSEKATRRQKVLAIDPNARPGSIQWLRAYRTMMAAEAREREAQGIEEGVPLIRHAFMIRSAYADGAMSERRLALSQRTVIPALGDQVRRDFEVIVKVDPRDPFLAERKAMFESTGLETSFIEGRLQEPSFNDQQGLGGAWPRGGPMLQSRLDDDDAITPDYVERLRWANFDPQDRAVFSFPNGWDGPIGEAKLRRYPDSMFLSLYTPSGDDASVYDWTHNDLWRSVRNQVTVDLRPAWVHYRHPDQLTALHPRTR